MVPELRHNFKAKFEIEKYNAFIKDLQSLHLGAIEFRIAETPVFVDRRFTKKMLDACEHIIDIIIDPKFKSLTDRAIPQGEFVPGESPKSQMIAFDFGVCINAQKELEPQLIEMQGFPTLFGFQVFYPELLRNYFEIPPNFSHYLNSYTKRD